MTTTWTLTAQEICSDALEHIGALAAGETPSAEDINTALRGLDAVLKELPSYGYQWPKVSGEGSLAWVSGQTVALPSDFYGYPVVWKATDGNRVRLTEITHADWIEMPSRHSDTGEPSHFYVGPDRQLYFYPTPATDPVAVMQYQRVIDDAELTVTPDVLQIWKYPLGYGVANEISMKFGIDQPTRVEINQRWSEKRERALQSSISTAPVSFSVAD